MPLVDVDLEKYGSAAAQQASSFGQYQRAPLYSEAMTTSQYLAMRDGVRLAISIQTVDTKSDLGWTFSPAVQLS